jgi:flagellar basal-body rod protein FlgC
MMSDPFQSIFKIAGAGLRAQSMRLQVASENITNARMSPTRPGETPFARKTVSFRSEMDRASGANLLKVSSIDRDRTAFPLEYNPSHQAADARGYVQMPNVNIYLEMADLKEASRSYQANLQSVRTARDMYSSTIELLKS